jgi:hypothetical protein
VPSHGVGIEDNDRSQIDVPLIRVKKVFGVLCNLAIYDGIKEEGDAAGIYTYIYTYVYIFVYIYIYIHKYIHYIYIHKYSRINV